MNQNNTEKLTNKKNLKEIDLRLSFLAFVAALFLFVGVTAFVILLGYALRFVLENPRYDWIGTTVAITLLLVVALWTIRTMPLTTEQVGYKFRLQQYLKRLLDLMLSLFGLILLFPLLFYIAIIIKLDSPGPVLYRSQRVGMNGRLFDIFKFRTMYVNIEKILAKYPDVMTRIARNQKLEDYPRITLVGNVLRRLSLDELPQLVNVFIGEMSMVGPRPIMEDKSRNYGQHYLLYIQVHPGITGLWQVSRRKSNGYEDKDHFDEYYVRNWSIWLDLYILLKTIWVVLRNPEAY